jgi:hypothetical protein
MRAIQGPMTAAEVSLGEYVKLLLLELQNKKIPMPFQNEEKWHTLFYRAKKEYKEAGRPSFLDELRFDWDGPYPRSQDLSEYLQTLHWNGFVSVANPSYDRLSVDADVLKGADKTRPVVKDEELEKFLRFTTKEASELFA